MGAHHQVSTGSHPELLRKPLNRSSALGFLTDQPLWCYGFLELLYTFPIMTEQNL